MDFLVDVYFIVLPFVVTGFMTWIVKILKRQNAERQANSKGTMLMLRDLIENKHAKYMKQGYVNYEQNNKFKDLYEAYHDLGGNGYATHMWEDIKKLDVRNDDYRIYKEN